MRSRAAGCEQANLRSLTDRNDWLTEWDYDNRYRVTSETWKTGTTTDRTLTYAYDTSDRTTSIDDSDPLASDFQFAYDDRSQLLAERQLTGLVGTSVVLDRTFDGDGNRLSLGVNFGGTFSGSSVTGGIDDFTREFAYDGLDRLTSVSSSTASGGHAVAPKLATFDYNAASQRTDLRRYSATTASSSDLELHSRRAYDQAGRLTSITHGTAEIAAGESWDGTSSLPASLGSTDMLAGYFFGYDQDNRLVDFSSYRDGTETSYGYDNRDQLTSAATAAINGLSQPFGLASSESYDFDSNGNRKSSSGQSQSAADTHNQLQSDGTYNYTYDDEGNTLTKTSIATGEVTEYEWDHRNRLVLVTERVSAAGAITQQVKYVYDAFDQRVGKRVDSDGDGSWDRDEAFVWADGQTVLRLVDSDGEGTSEPFRVANRYLYGDVVDEILADEQYADGAGPAVDAGTASTTAGETLWTVADHLGSVRDLVDNNGVVRQHVVYDSFGNRLVEQDYDASGTAIASSHADAVDTLFGYTGRDWDADVELQNNRARWYDPTTGRWLSQDPIGFQAGDANLYRYVGNGPTTKLDPSGLDDEAPYSSRPVGAFPGTVDDLLIGQLAELVGDPMFRMTDGPKLTGGGRAVLVQGSNGNAIWLIPMLGLNSSGNTVQKGTFVFDDYEGACDQVQKNHELAWLAASGQVLRDIAGTAEIGTLPGVGKAVTRTAAALAARRARPGIVRLFASADPYVSTTATQLDALFPGRVVAVNKHLPASVAGGSREVDILMDQFAIQVKGGKAKGLAGQVQECAATLTDKSRHVIGYAPENYSGHAWTRAANEGIPIARNFEELVAIIKELSR